MLNHIKHDIDHGTPKRESAEEVSLTIDGYKVHVPKGTSIMRAAMDAGIKVPKLCATDTIEPFSVKGRHDLCIALRVPVILEAVTAIIITDLMLLEQRIMRII
jgi:predicted molibdopterin-dependent oxidoreductase YjgC